MNRIDIINAYVKKLNAESYLEVGVQAGHCFNAIDCKHKVGVDPDESSAATIFKTSDAFFKTNEEKFKVIFNDGYHVAEQLYKDVINSLKALEDGGIILVHDCLPTNEFMQLVPLTTQNEWTGNVWKAFVTLRTENENLEMKVVNTDWGVGIIRKLNDGEPRATKLVLDCELTYENFEKNKHHWMNVISVDEFKNSMS